MMLGEVLLTGHASRDVLDDLLGEFSECGYVFKEVSESLEKLRNISATELIDEQPIELSVDNIEAVQNFIRDNNFWDDMIALGSQVKPLFDV